MVGATDRSEHVGRQKAATLVEVETPLHCHLDPQRNCVSADPLESAKLDVASSVGIPRFRSGTTSQGFDRDYQISDRPEGILKLSLMGRQGFNFCQRHAAHLVGCQSGSPVRRFR